MAELGEGSSQPATLEDKLIEKLIICVENCENGNTEWHTFPFGKSIHGQIGKEVIEVMPKEVSPTIPTKVEPCPIDESNQMGIGNEDESFHPQLWNEVMDDIEEYPFYSTIGDSFQSETIPAESEGKSSGTASIAESEGCDDVYQKEKKKKRKKEGCDDAIIEDSDQTLIRRLLRSVFPELPEDSNRGESNRIKTRNQEPIAALSLRMHVRWVVLRSIIYCIGTGKSQKSESSPKRNRPQNYQSDVYCFDITRPEQGWYLGPCMMSPRFFPCTLVLDGKLYVMGGVTDFNFGLPWAEVFDPITGKWEALPDPPGNLGSRLVYAASHDDGESKIVLGAYGKTYIYEYNAANKDWEGPYPCIKFEYSGPAVAFDGKVYWFTETGHLSAYDLRYELLYTGRVDKRKDIDPYATLVHLGGEKFCLLWISGPSEPNSDSDSDSDDYVFKSGSGSCFHCLKFEVSMGIKNRKPWLKACNHTSQSFVIDAGVSFMDAMLM